MKNSSSIVNSLKWKVSERALAQIINIVIQIVMARLISPNEFGSIAIPMAVINYTSIFVQSGLSTSLIRKQNLKKDDVTTAFTLSMLVASFFSIIIVIVAPTIGVLYDAAEMVEPLRVLSLILFFDGYNSIQTALLTREMQFKSIMLRTLLAIPLSGLLGISAAIGGLGVWAIVIQTMTNNILICMFMAIGKRHPLRLGFSVDSAKEILPFGIRIIGANLVAGSHDIIRTLVIGKTYTKSELAYYDKAYSYSGYIGTAINQSLSSVMLPVFASKQNSLLYLKQLARKYFGFTAYLVMPIFVGMASISEPLIRILLKEQWIPCIPFFSLFCIFRIFGCLQALDKQVFYAMGRSDISLKYEVGVLCTNISVLLCLKNYGIIYIAYGAFAVELIATLVMFVISSSVYSYTIQERFLDVLKPTINSLIMALVVWKVTLLPFASITILIIKIVSGVLVYIIMSYVTRDKHFLELVSVIRMKKTV